MQADAVERYQKNPNKTTNEKIYLPPTPPNKTDKRKQSLSGLKTGYLEHPVFKFCDENRVSDFFCFSLSDRHHKLCGKEPMLCFV